MENYEYYKSLAEQIFFKGLKSEEVSNFASYKPNKSFQDLKEAFFQGRLDGVGKFYREIATIADRIYEVIEIDTNYFNRIYGKPDDDI